jgi:hypothetical protein
MKKSKKDIHSWIVELEGMRKWPDGKLRKCIYEIESRYIGSAVIGRKGKKEND